MGALGTQGTFKFLDHKLIIKIRSRICETPEELLSSELMREVLTRYLRHLQSKESPLMDLFSTSVQENPAAIIELTIQMLQFLGKMPLEYLPRLLPAVECYTKNPVLLSAFVEGLYDYWREYERFIVCDSESEALDQRPYRTFNATVETLTHLVRRTYRDVQENISGKHPNIYRQTPAGADIAAIALAKSVHLPPGLYQNLAEIHLIRQILLYPPLLLNPPMNKRTGRFTRVDQNPLELVKLAKQEWLCYPAKVGSLLILVYFHEKFYELGFSLCNLFELADDVFLHRPVDAVFLFGVPAGLLDHLATQPTIFYDDLQHNILTAAVPAMKEFGYFGYLKKMILSLHNIKIMQLGKLPYHGAMLKITLRNGKSKTLLIIGDTGTGKSETLEAFRGIGTEVIKDITIIADDMGSLEIDPQERIIGYGTEIGAFVRLDDLHPGYAFGQLDRAIIMNPNQVNARVILPVTTYQHVIEGHPLDMVLYANNYEAVDEEHPILDRVLNLEKAISIFREGTAMSKGTTTATGLVHTYFVNIFGAVQYRPLHEQIAYRYFETFFKQDLWVGQLRTRLGIPGWEQSGPEEAAQELLRLFQSD
jgi:energy-coupling factor transporter ATP-binding protein EcfA2